jgi:hypothetical protein
MERADADEIGGRNTLIESVGSKVAVILARRPICSVVWIFAIYQR